MCRKGSRATSYLLYVLTYLLIYYVRSTYSTVESSTWSHTTGHPPGMGKHHRLGLGACVEPLPLHDREHACGPQKHAFFRYVLDWKLQSRIGNYRSLADSTHISAASTLPGLKRIATKKDPSSDLLGDGTTGARPEKASVLRGAQKAGRAGGKTCL